MPTLTAHTAEITTATIQIQTLTISGNKVTQALFRQLKEQPLITDNGTLNGTPWGTVNYHPDKCADHHFHHIHVVWQSGPELRRARIDTPGAWFQEWVRAEVCPYVRRAHERRRSGGTIPSGRSCIVADVLTVELPDLLGVLLPKLGRMLRELAPFDDRAVS